MQRVKTLGEEEEEEDIFFLNCVKIYLKFVEIMGLFSLRNQKVLEFLGIIL